jgi:pimeloyl-ACP methyl ester carboxylesterase
MSRPADAWSRDIKRPHRALLLAEGRGLAELGWFFASRPWLKAILSKGDGQPVLVLPGFTATDRSTAPMRGLMKDLGYEAHAWEMGRNLGPRAGVMQALADKLDDLHRRHGRKVALVGWSLGGTMAREIAKAVPHHVSMVVTLGSPFSRGGGSNASRAYAAVNGRPANPHPRMEQLPVPPPVPTTSIYSRSDGIVAFQASRNAPGKQVENIEVPGSHLGLGHNPIALYALFDRLAQPDGTWKPFDRSGLRGAIFRDPDRA